MDNFPIPKQLFFFPNRKWIIFTTSVHPVQIMQILFCATSYQRLAPSTFRRCVYHREIKNQFSYIIIWNMIFLRPQLLPKSRSIINSFFTFLRGRNVRKRFFNDNLASTPKSGIDFNQDFRRTKTHMGST